MTPDWITSDPRTFEAQESAEKQKAFTARFTKAVLISAGLADRRELKDKELAWFCLDCVKKKYPAATVSIVEGILNRHSKEKRKRVLQTEIDKNRANAR